MAMTKKSTLSILFFSFAILSLFSQPKVIAHRGFWKTEGSAQNSIAALMKADSIRAYGSETDFWITSDGVPVVNHDADVTLDGQKLVIEQTPFETLRKVRLANGEPLPTVEEYLDAFAKCAHTKLIIEFKSHKSKENEDALAQKVIAMVHEKGLQHRVEYIAFGINFINLVRKLDPAAPVYYLNGDLAPHVIHTLGASGVDYHHSVFQKYPEWVQQCHNLGLKVNAWTVNSAEDIQKVLDLKVDFITTDEPLLTQKIIEERE